MIEHVEGNHIQLKSHLVGILIKISLSLVFQSDPHFVMEPIAFYKYVIFPYLLNRVSNCLDVFLLVSPIEESGRV